MKQTLLMEPAPPVLPGRAGIWQCEARDGHVSVSWQADAAGTEVGGTIAAGAQSWPYKLGLNLGPVVHHFGGSEITVALSDKAPELLEPGPRGSNGQVWLVVNVPLTNQKGFDGAIASWFSVDPDVDPGEDDDPYEVEIDAPHQPSDLFPFVWLHPAGPRQLLDMARRYMLAAVPTHEPSSWTFYQQLAAIQGSDATAAAAKRLAAQKFRKDGCPGSTFIAALSELSSTVRQFPLWRLEVELLTGPQYAGDLQAAARACLDQPPADFLAGSEWQTAQAQIWQTLFALALAGAAADAPLCAGLIDVLRFGHYLQLLAGIDAAAELDAAWRRLVLRAQPVFPDVAAALAPSPAIDGPAPPGTAGYWSVRGAGTLKMARQHPGGYLAGEVADVVNVMPHERQEVQQRLAAQRGGHERGSDERRHDSHDGRVASAANELGDAVRQQLAAGALVRDLNNVNPAYDNLNMTLKGAWAGGDGGSAWHADEAARYAQQLTQQAASHLAERISAQRGSVWDEFRERRLHNLIDNSGDQRLVGIYRWVDRLVRVHMHNCGRRLVLSVTLDHPSGDWLARIAAQGAVPLVKPVPLTLFSVPDGQGYLQLTAANYQGYGAQYGLLDLAAPPAADLTVSARYDRASLDDPAGMRIPDGYSAVAGQLTMGLADQRYNLVCVVAGTAYQSAAPAPVPVLGVAVPTPATDGASVQDAVVNTPAMPVSAMTSTALKFDAPVSAMVPVTVMSAAPAFVVKVDLQCSRTAPATGDQAIIAWQIETFERLLLAYQAACVRYDEQLAARVAAASDGRGAEVQRAVLRQQCLRLLAPASAGGQDYRALEPLLDWSAMGWQYDNWGAAAPDNWPDPVASVKTQPSSEQLFRQFLQASSVSIMLPASHGWEAWLLFYLQYQQPWPGSPDNVPLTASTMLLLEEIVNPGNVVLRAPDGELLALETLLRPGTEASWTVRLPTSMLYLQKGAELPTFKSAGRA
ncbi:hypothetical protein [Duganella sp. Dugasp56]|uniref:hypothetical protein n=1 Tax=Duganella sp. Dugasp56 TaxID=3243046 RepID=UPI00159E96D8